MVLKNGFEKEFDIILEEGGLTREEKQLFLKKKGKFESQTRINKIKLPKDKQQMIYSIYKTKGGLIRLSLMVNLSFKILQSVVITSDFFVYPKRFILDLEAVLKDIPIDVQLIEKRISALYHEKNPQIPGISSVDLTNAFQKALEGNVLGTATITGMYGK